MRVRGGFDSHTFPPLLCLWCAVLLAVSAGPASAQNPPAPADTMILKPTFGEPGPRPAPAADSASIRTFGARAKRGEASGSTEPQSRWDEPGWVMMRSAVFPGWGQASNGAWLKAGVIGGIEAALIVSIIQDQSELQRLDDQANAAHEAGDTDAENSAILEYNAVLDQSNQRSWWLGGVIVYSMIDAYVDAHFRRFKVEFETDPALPGGKPPGGRLTLRWTF